MDSEPDDGVIERIVAAAAAAALPSGLAALVAAPRTSDPQVSELWRVGRHEAQLAWARRVFPDGVADVIPVTLHVQHADAGWLLLPPESSPLAMELGAVTSLRTHIVFEAFLNRMAVLPIGPAIAEVMAAAHAGRPPIGVRTGPDEPVDATAAFGFRQSLRAFYFPLTPGAWA